MGFIPAKINISIDVHVEDRLRAILKLAREGEGDQSKYSKGGTWKLCTLG